MPKRQLQRAIPTPIVTYEKPFPQYPFQPEPIPHFTEKQAQELEQLIPKATIAVPAYGTPVALVDRYSGTSTTYKEVVKWQVERGTYGELKEISMVTDNYSKTMFRLRIAGRVYFEDKIIQAPLTLPFPETKLRPTAEVVIECKSVDGTAITVDGSITGREIPIGA